MVERERFNFALRELGHGQWERFEQLASAFLAGDFDDLRTMASPSGDRGRDAQLFATGDPTVLVQYSVAKDWRAKVNSTVKRVTEAFPKVSLLVYVTNQQIGAEADELIKKLREERRLILDVRCRTWFLDRMHRDRAREVAAEQLARDIVDPLLADDGLIERRPSPLSNTDMRAAVVHLELQWANDERDKGLSRTAYEALVRSVLRNTKLDSRMSREEVHTAVHELLPSHGAAAAETVKQHTDRALKKLASKKEGNRLINHWQQRDEFCLTHEERLRLDEHLVEESVHEETLENELGDLISGFATNFGEEAEPDSAELDLLLVKSRRVLEQFLLGRGEAFAVAMSTGHSEHLDFQDLRDLTIKEFAEEGQEGNVPRQEFVENVVREIVLDPGGATRRYLRRLIDAYTLLAFLQETPDVQRIVKEMFSHGEVWLDTNILLPLVTESLIEEEAQQYRPLISVAREAGLQLYVTSGVLEELKGQVKRALKFTRSDTWDGTVPFIYKVYALAGQSRDSFGAWVEDFMGQERPEDDLAEFLKEEFGIQKQSLDAQATELPDELRYAAQESWMEIHEKRREQSGYDKGTAETLAKHDAENYLGVIARRTGSSDSPFGYSSWWLTLHRAAFRIEPRLRKHLEGDIPKSPVMSPDFLTNYLAFGPLRNNVNKELELTLPIALGSGLTEFLSPEVVLEAEKVREKFAHLPQRRMRRQIRDAMDRARRREGELAKTGLSGVEQRARNANALESIEEG